MKNMYDSTKYVRKRVPHLDFHQSCQQMGGPGRVPGRRHRHSLQAVGGVITAPQSEL